MTSRHVPVTGHILPVRHLKLYFGEGGGRENLSEGNTPCELLLYHVCLHGNTINCPSVALLARYQIAKREL